MWNRRQKVMQVAQQLFIEKGFTETSIQDILTEAGISKGTFYNYFTSKNDCLIAILERAQQEANVEREQILLEAKQDSKTVFAKQIVVRMEINRKQNIISLLGFIFYTKDEDLRAFSKKQHVTELAWIAKRFIELYGQEIKSVAIDCAVILFGIIQQYSAVWSLYATETLDRHQLVEYSLQRIDVIIPDLIEKKESFIDRELFQSIHQQISSETCKNDEVIQLLTTVKEEWENDERGIEFISFFLEELSRKSPRIYLLESMIQSFYDHFQQTEKMLQAREVTERLLAFVTSIKNK